MSRAIKRRATIGISVVAAALTVTSALTVPAVAAPDTGATIPGLSELPAIPGLPGTGDSPLATMDADGRTNINLPMVPEGGVRKQFTNAPAVEQSTGPACAPFVLVNVPGTFEINRDDDPNTPVGMLKKLSDPLKAALGSKLSVTSINYDADAGVNGTGYAQSTGNGGKITLATITDVAERCPTATIILAGYSQGADIAGDVATDIGQKRTSVDPNRIGGVALFSDPQRAQSTNVISGTNQSRPTIPEFLQGAVDAIMSDPSFAQLQLQVTDGVESLLNQFGPTAAAGTTNTQSTQEAGQSVKTTAPSAGQDAPTSSDTDEQSGTTTTPKRSTGQTPPRTTPRSGSTQPSDGTMAGASTQNTELHVQLAEDITGLLRAEDQLTPVTAGSTAPEGVVSVGSPEGQWVPIDGLTQADIAAKAEQGWVYGRTAADKDLRRSVVSDLYLYGWEGCGDKTLQRCMQEYVDGVDDGSNAPGILIASSELTATRDQLGVDAAPVRPADGNLAVCATLTATDCNAKLAFVQAKDSDRATKVDVSKLTEELAQELLPKIVSINYPGAEPVAVEDVGRQMENPDAADDKDTSNNVDKGSMLSQCGAHEAYPTDNNAPQSERNAWLLQAWKVVTNKATKDADRSDPEWTDREVVGCFPWAARVINEIEAQYLAGTLVYDDPNYVAPNSASVIGGADDRNRLIAELYVYGGCGAAALTDGKTAAPDGEWTLATCKQELNVTEGKAAEGSNAELGPAQLQVAVALARDTYMAAPPADWKAEELEWADLTPGGTATQVAKTLLVLPPVAGPVSSRWTCEDFSIRICSIMKTSIPGPADSGGVTEMVQPAYPTRNEASGETVIGDAPSSKITVDPADTAKVDSSKADGYLWATPEVVSAVGLLDQAREAARGGQAKHHAPDNNGSPVDWIINTDGTRASVAELDEAELHRRLDTGWVWGYTDAELADRGALVDSLYIYGGCYGADGNQLTYADCTKLFLNADPDSATAEFAIPSAELDQRITDAKESGDLGFDPGSAPASLTECNDKVIADCVPKAAPATTTEPIAGEVEDDTTGTDSTETDSTGTTPTAETSTTTGTTGTSGTDSDNTSSSDSTSTPRTTRPTGATTTTRTPAVAGVTTPSKPAQAGSATTTRSTRAGSTTTPAVDTAADGGLANQYADMITNPAAPVVRVDGERVQITPITQQAVAGGGLAGPRDANFGALEGRVVSLCVAGDLVCSLPEDSQIATDLANFAQNVSLNFPDMLGAEGATRMGGLLALQAVNMVTDTTGLPRTKLSAETLQALIDITAGAAMLAMENPAGMALVAKGVGQLPKAIPELFEQLQDVPAILQQLPSVPQTAAEKTGLDDVLARVTAAFADAGMQSPLELEKLPEAIPAVMTAMVEDNTGLVNLVTNPQYWQANAHNLYPELEIAGSMGSIDWVAQWVTALSKLAGSS